MSKGLVLCALFAALVILACGGEEPEVPLAESLDALFPLAGELLAAAEEIEEEGFETTSWLLRVDEVPATHELARRAKAALRESVNAFGSYTVGRLPDDYVTAMDYYHRFEGILDDILAEVMNEDETR